MMNVLIFCWSFVGAYAFLDRKGLHLFSLPETRSALHHAVDAAGLGRARWRLMRSIEGNYPEIHDAHEFVGETQHGFLSFNITSIVKSTTVNTDDYLDLLEAAALECTPRPVPSEHLGQGHVTLTIDFPPSNTPDLDALAHLEDRLSNPEAVLNFGVDTLLSHPSLGAESSCVEHVPGKDPFFRILSMAREGNSLSLDLSPTNPRDAFNYLSLSLEHDPDTQREVERRRALGLWTGRKLSVSFSNEIADYSVNYDKDSKGAKIPKISLFSAQPNALYCDNCYFYLSAKLNVKIEVCAIIYSASYTYYYDANIPTAIQTEGYGYYYSTGLETRQGKITTSDADARAKTDCKALNTATPNVFDVGLSAEAYFEGGAGFNFAIKSDGISAKTPLTFPDTCSATPSSGTGIKRSFDCTPAKLPNIDKVTIPTITVTISGIPITIDPEIQLSGSAIASLEMPNLKLQFGASATVKLKLGGKLTIAGTGAPSSMTGYKNFTASYTPLPFILSGFTSAASTVDSTLVPTIYVKIWKIIPFIFTPNLSMLHKITAAISGRQLSLRDSSQPHERILQSTCASGSVSSAATAQGSLGVDLDKITAFGLIKSLTNVDMKTAVGGAVAATVSDITVVPFTNILSPGSTPFSVTGFGECSELYRAV